MKYGASIILVLFGARLVYNSAALPDFFTVITEQRVYKFFIQDRIQDLFSLLWITIHKSIGVA